MRRYVVLLCALVLVGSLGTAHAVSYTGGLSTLDGGLVANGLWGEGAFLGWEIWQNNDLSWHYWYVLEVGESDISHVIFQVSDTFTGDDIVGGSIKLNDEPGFYDEIGTQKTGQGNVGMPSGIWGIKFSGTSTSMTYAFDSWRVPVWQDFYAKGGRTGGDWNYLYNAGFTDPNPLVGAHDGTEGYHILAPALGKPGGRSGLRRTGCWLTARRYRPQG